MSSSALHQKLSNGGSLIVAEGYVYELERRGFLQAGPLVPDVVLKHPEVVKALHEEFVRAGSEVVIALTYYAHREKLRDVGIEDQVETLNRKALTIAREVARSTGTLFAGDICNSCVYQRDDKDSLQQAKAMFKEQIEWAVDEGVDLIIAETFSELGEAMLALNCIKEYGKGVPAIVNIAPTTRHMTYDRVPYAEACRRLEDAGAAVVGLNCGRGPATMLPLILEIRKACKGPIACLPVAYRTSPDFPTLQSLRDPVTGQRALPHDLPAHFCGRSEVKKYAEACKEMGVQVVGICCGNCSHYTRVLAEVYGRTPPSSAYSPNMSKHSQFGNTTNFKNYYTQELARWKSDI